MAGVFFLGGLAAIVIICVAVAIFNAIEYAKQEACNQARRDGHSTGYRDGKEYMSDEFKRDAIRLGYAFYSPNHGDFTWKDIDQVRRDTDPVVPISAAKAE